MKLEKLNTNSYNQFIEHTNTKVIEPYHIPDKAVNNNILKLTTTVKPIFSTKFIKDNEYEIIKINSKDQIISKIIIMIRIYIYIYICI